MTLKKFLDDLVRETKQTPQILDAEIVDVDILKIQHDGTETVETICINALDGNKMYTFVSTFND